MTIFERFYKKNNNKNNQNICVVIPARNEEKNLPKTINSIVRQDLNNISILIIDDNSTDKTLFVDTNLLTKKKLIIKLSKVKNYPMVGVGKYGP